MSGYRCLVCDGDIPHPHTDEDCPTRGMACATLLDQGARPAFARVEAEDARGRFIHVVSRLGWLCPTCAGRYLPRAAAVRKLGV